MTALTVRPYTPADYEMVNAWYQSHHGELSELPEALLPPLGVMVEDADGPAGALWLYEAFGAPVAFLEWPVSRPGLSLLRAEAVFVKAVESVIALAGQCITPRGEYNVFRAFTPPAIFRTLRKMGFMRASSDVTPCLFIKE